MPSSLSKQKVLENYPCKKCGIDRLYNEYEIKRERHLTSFCQPCSVKVYNESRTKQTKEERKAKQDIWANKHKHHLAIYYSEYREKIKLEMVEAFGGECLECGEDDPIVLVLDHIKDDGHIDRKNGIEGGFKLYQQLKKLGWPKDRHQLLCHNCNFKKEYKRRKDAVRFKSTG